MFWTAARRLALSSLLLIGIAILWSVAAHLGIERAAQGRIYGAVSDVPARPAAIVLGARVYQDGTLSPVLADRVACALALHRAGKVQRILVSGDHGNQRYDEVNAMADALTKAGIDAAAVFRDHAGFRTLDTMRRAQRVFDVRGAVLCTQQFHLPRSLYLARHFGIDAVGLIADRRAYPSALHDRLRENLAQASALFDITVGRSAHFLGARHPISGDGRSTADRPTSEIR